MFNKLSFKIGIAYITRLTFLCTENKTKILNSNSLCHALNSLNVITSLLTCYNIVINVIFVHITTLVLMQSVFNRALFLNLLIIFVEAQLFLYFDFTTKGLSTNTKCFVYFYMRNKIHCIVSSFKQNNA